jgi:hypothetical protein
MSTKKMMNIIMGACQNSSWNDSGIIWTYSCIGNKLHYSAKGKNYKEICSRRCLKFDRRFIIKAL